MFKDEVMNEIAQKFGVEVAFLLIKRLGGYNLLIGKKPKTCDYKLLELVLGEELALKFCEHFSACKIYIPKNEEIAKIGLKRRFAQVIREFRKEGNSFWLSMRLAAVKLRISESVAKKLFFSMKIKNPAFENRRRLGDATS